MSQPYNAFKKMRSELRVTDAYNIPGPTQFDAENCKASLDVPMTLQLELGKPLDPLPVDPSPTNMGLGACLQPTRGHVQSPTLPSAQLPRAALACVGSNGNKPQPLLGRALSMPLLSVPDTPPTPLRTRPRSELAAIAEETDFDEKVSSTWSTGFRSAGLRVSRLPQLGCMGRPRSRVSAAESACGTAGSLPKSQREAEQVRQSVLEGDVDRNSRLDPEHFASPEKAALLASLLPFQWTCAT